MRKTLFAGVAILAAVTITTPAFGATVTEYGEKIAFTRSSIGVPPTLGFVNPDGSQIKITSRSSVQSIAWQKSGQQTPQGFAVTLSDDVDPDIFVNFGVSNYATFADNLGLSPINDTGDIELDVRFAFGGNGLAYSARPGGGGIQTLRVLVKESFQSQPRLMGIPRPIDAEDRHPSVSPNGRFVAFVSTRGSDDPGNPTYGIYIADIETGSIVSNPIVQGADPSSTPEWSPAGDRLLLSVTYRGSYDIAVIGIEPDTGEPNLSGEIYAVSSGSSETNPAWSPDGNQIAYVRAGNEILRASSDPLNSTPPTTVYRAGLGQFVGPLAWGTVPTQREVPNGGGEPEPTPDPGPGRLDPLPVLPGPVPSISCATEEQRVAKANAAYRKAKSQTRKAKGRTAKKKASRRKKAASLNLDRLKKALKSCQRK